MRKERFPAHRRSKLNPRGDGPFQILEKINDNAYKVDLPGEFNVSATFNVADLCPFDVGDDSRSFQRTDCFGHNSRDKISLIKLSLVSDVAIPHKFKMPDFVKYNGSICPKAH